MRPWFKLLLCLLATVSLWYWGGVPLPVALVVVGLVLLSSIQIGYNNIDVRGHGNVVRRAQ